MKSKYYFVHWIMFLLIWTYLLFKGLFITSYKVQGQEFTSPTQTILEMNALTADGSINYDLPNGKTACYSVQSNRQEYGCTNFPNNFNKSYPFLSDTITLNIESDQRFINGETVQLGYLHNVTPQEVAISVASQGNKPLACVMAQAIAARTYLYWHIHHNSSINNSTEFQVYMPYRYYDTKPKGACR